MPHLKVLALFLSSIGDPERQDNMASCMRSKGLHSYSQEPSTGLKNFDWLQMWMELGLLMTWYSGTD